MRRTSCPGMMLVRAAFRQRCGSCATICMGAVAMACAGCPAPSGPVTPHEDGTVSTVAGTGEAGYGGDGGAAAIAQIDSPADVAIDADGNLLIADFGNHRIRRVNLSTGQIDTIAGNGTTSGQDGLIAPTGVTPLTGGGFLAVSWAGHCVFRYSAAGTRELLAGNGDDACAVPAAASSAVERSLLAPRSADVLADGSVLVAEQGCHRVCRVRNDGSIEAYAGSGQAGYAGDDDDAVLAALHAGPVDEGPSFGVSLSPEDPPDELFIADTANHVIRVVKPFTGRIETFAGDGTAGFADGPPEQARFNRPTHVFSNRDHSLWIVDSGNHAIRYIDPLNTRVETIAGTGAAGFNGDGLPPLSTQFNAPAAVWVSAEGVVFVADAGNHRVRMFRSR